MKAGRTLGLIGCGRMAHALLTGLGRSHHGFQQTVVFDVDATRREDFVREFAARPALSNCEVVAQTDVVVVAVKPDQVGSILDETCECFGAGTLVISIAAGITLRFIEDKLVKRLPVVRVMPNTPCLVGEGISGVAGGSWASADDVDLVLKMFSSLGQATRVPESYMDAVTAVSGSGPAYIYLVVEAMTDAGVDIGMPRELARALVLQTIKGSVAMLESTGEHPAVLREQVTSPGGTTIAGLRQLEEHGLRKAFYRAICQAYKRSVELGQS